MQILSDHKSRSLSPLSQLSIFLVTFRVFLLMSLTVPLLQECITNCLYWDTGKTTLCVCVCITHTHTHTHMLICEQLFVTPWTWTVVWLSMEFFRQEYWSRLPFPSPDYLPNPGIETESLEYPALAVRFFTSWTTREAPKTLEQPDSLISLFPYPFEVVTSLSLKVVKQRLDNITCRGNSYMRWEAILRSFQI